MSSQAVDQLKKAEHISVYLKSEIPDRYHFKNHHRIKDALIVADEGWYIQNQAISSSSTAGEVLISAGTDGTIPTWGPLDLTNSNSTTNALAGSRGGTGQTSYAKGDILYADANGDLQKLAIAGDFNNRIISNNGGIPVWKYPYEIRHSASIVSNQVQTTSGVTVATVPAGARILRVHIDIVEAYQQDSAIAIGDSGDTDRLTAGEIWGTVAGTRHTYEIDYQYASETDVIATITMIISLHSRSEGSIKFVEKCQRAARPATHF